MRTLTDRLREALAPKYAVDHELGRGGMGAVFLARDEELERPVAIKVLLPEIATAQSAERFLRESHILARIAHSHVVPVHEVGETDGLQYYVMSYLEGDTLDERLRERLLSRAEVLKLARDLLDALETVHRSGIIHRDIKPSNIMLVGNRAVLMDFGIAKSGDTSTPKLTEEGHAPLSYHFCAPEQMHPDGIVSPQTDMYVLALVIYEALTGREWKPMTDPHRANWSGVPSGIARILRAQLALDPADRPYDAPTFRRRLWHTRTTRYRLRALALTIGGLIVGGASVYLLTDTVCLGCETRVPELAVRFEDYRSTTLDASVRDSVIQRISGILGSTWDVAVCDPDTCGDAIGAVVGFAEVTGEYDVSVRSDGARTSILSVFQGEASDWHRPVDSVAYGFLRRLWSDESRYGEYLPTDAAPTTELGWLEWMKAERLTQQGRWGEALQAYHQAAAVDSTCLICSWRITEVERWHVQPPSPDHLRRLHANLDRFPEHYQILISSRALPLVERIDTLRYAASLPGLRRFYPIWFQLGAELFHRGPLIGLPRREARVAFEEVVDLIPDHTPTWEFLTWLAIAEGDPGRATETWATLTRLDARHASPDPLTAPIRTLLGAALAFRFERPDRFTGVGASVERAGPLPDLAAGPRFMPSFEATAGAIELGDLLAYLQPDNDAVQFARAFAHVSAHTRSGHLDSARIHLETMRVQFAETFYASGEFADKLDAVWAVIPPDWAGGAAGGSVRARIERLTPYAEVGSDLMGGAEGARWLIHLVSALHGLPPPSGIDRPRVEPLAGSLRAAALAQAGHIAGALAVADSLRSSEVAARLVRDDTGLKEVPGSPDPFFRTVMHVLRGRWRQQLAESEHAYRELLWYQNSDANDIPTRQPLVQEIDWMFASVARSGQLEILREADRRRDQRDPRRCGLARQVAQAWRQADAVLQRRAQDAAREASGPECAPASEIPGQ